MIFFRLLLLFLFSINVCWAQNLAVVIGNNSYKNVGKLDNPINDANLISSKFTNLGYEVWLNQDLNEIEFNNLVKKIAKNSSRFDTTAIYYAGHAVQLGGLNYLLPIDQIAPETEEDVTLSAVVMDDLVNAIRSPHKIVLMDACRNNPLVQQTLAAKGRGLLSRGLAPPNITSGGIFIAYATASGDVATDGAGQNSPFAASLARHLENPESIDDMFSRVTKDVLNTTNSQQRPFKYASLEGRFCLPGPCDSLVAINVPTPTSSKYKPTIEPKKIVLEQDITFQVDKLGFYEEWVTYEWSKENIFQFQPRSFKYDAKTKVASVKERRVKNITGLASIFAANGEYTEMDVKYFCEKNYHVTEKSSSFDRDGKLLGSYTFAPEEAKKNITSGSILEAGHATFCGPEANTFNMINSTTTQGQEFYGNASNIDYYWNKQAKKLVDDKTFYAVLASYKNPIHISAIDKMDYGEIVIASASCKNKEAAIHVRSFFVNGQGKIYRQLKWLPSQRLNLVGSSPGYTILSEDCSSE